MNDEIQFATTKGIQKQRTNRETDAETNKV